MKLLAWWRRRRREREREHETMAAMRRADEPDRPAPMETAFSQTRDERRQAGTAKATVSTGVIVEHCRYQRYGTPLAATSSGRRTRSSGRW